MKWYRSSIEIQLGVEKDKLEWFFELIKNYKKNNKSVDLTESFIKFREEVASIQMEDEEIFNGYQRIHWKWSKTDVSL